MTEVNPFLDCTPSEFREACNKYIRIIEERPRRTKVGDEIRYLLLAAAMRVDPPGVPAEGFSGRG